MIAISRKLSNLEKGQELLNFYYEGSANLVLINKISGTLSTDLVRQALDALQEQTPFLQCRIIESHQDLYLTTESITKIPLQVIKKKEADLQDIVEEELNKTIDSSKCLIRTTAICNQTSENIKYLITTVHHAITDGRSCMALQEKLFYLCQEIQEQKYIPENNEKNFSPDDLIYLEKLLPRELFTIRGNIQKNVITAKAILRNTFSKHKTLEPEKKGEIEDYQCCISQREISVDLTEKIINNCRQNQTTANSAICAATLIAVTNQIRKRKEQKIKASCLISVDLRKLVNPTIEPEQLGCINSFLVLLHNISYDHSLWDLAKEVKQQVTQKIANQEMFLNIRAFSEGFARPVHIRDQSMLDKFANTVNVTNVGKVQIRDDYGNFKLEEISFIASNRALSRSIAVAVATFKRKMMINFATSEPSISQLTRETIANDVVNYLTKSLVDR